MYRPLGSHTHWHESVSKTRFGPQTMSSARSGGGGNKGSKANARAQGQRHRHVMGSKTRLPPTQRSRSASVQAQPGPTKKAKYKRNLGGHTRTSTSASQRCGLGRTCTRLRARFRRCMRASRTLRIAHTLARLPVKDAVARAHAAVLTAAGARVRVRDQARRAGCNSRVGLATGVRCTPRTFACAETRLGVLDLRRRATVPRIAFALAGQRVDRLILAAGNHCTHNVQPRGNDRKSHRQPGRYTCRAARSSESGWAGRLQMAPVTHCVGVLKPTGAEVDGIDRNRVGRLRHAAGDEGRHEQPNKGIHVAWAWRGRAQNEIARTPLMSEHMSRSMSPQHVAPPVKTAFHSPPMGACVTRPADKAGTVWLRDAHLTETGCITDDPQPPPRPPARYGQLAQRR